MYLSMHIQNLIKNHPFVLKILRKNTLLHQSYLLLFINEFRTFAIQNHSSLISMSMQSLKKIGQKLLKLESRNDIFTSIKGHISVVYKRIKPICNPKRLLLDMFAKFEKNRSNTTQVRIRKRSADGRTDTQNFKIFGGYNIISRHFLCGGV